MKKDEWSTDTATILTIELHVQCVTPMIKKSKWILLGNATKIPDLK